MLKFLYQKWIKGRCKHFCFLCQFRKEIYKTCVYELNLESEDE